MWLVVELVLGSLWFTRGKRYQSDHEVWGPQKTYFKAFIIHWHGPTGFFVGRGKRDAMIEKGKGPWQRNIVIINSLMIFFGEEKRRQKNGQIWFFFKISLFGHILYTLAHSFFWCMIIPLDPHSVTPSEGPKGFYFLLLIIFKNKLDYVKRPSSMVWLHGPWCKPGLIWIINIVSCFF